MSPNPAQQLITLGQSVWYDNISRDLLDSGEIKRLVQEWGVRGMTSNPTIFDNAIRKSAIYDKQITQLHSHPIPEIFEALAIDDIGRAADILRPVYQESEGNDGFVSIEVSPLLASDTHATIEEGKRLFKKLNRPNIMVKVPGTPEGLPAVHALLAEGINVNITLLFAVDNYVKVAETYCDALRERVGKGLDISKIRSVASFFVSRVDTIIDTKLAAAQEGRSYLGKFGVANSRIAYKRFEEIFGGEKFRDLKEKGAAVQRPLWASTGTKNPAYSDVLYVEELIGPNTVNTMPHDTLKAFIDHGKVKETIRDGLAEAEALEGKLRKVGVDVAACLAELQVDGVKKFSDSFLALNEAIKKKL